MTRSPSPTELTHLLRTARRIASEVGAYVSRRHRGVPWLTVRRKGVGDFVTEVDVAA